MRGKRKKTKSDGEWNRVICLMRDCNFYDIALPMTIRREPDIQDAAFQN